MLNRLVFLGLLLIIRSGPGLCGSAASTQAFFYLTVCEDQNRPILAYQNFLTDSPSLTKRTQEFWFDRNKELLQGLWFKNKEAPMYVIGKQYSDTQFYLCAYRMGQKKAFRVYLGRSMGSSVRFSEAGKSSAVITSLTGSRFLAEPRTYGLRFENEAILHEIPGKIPKDTPYTCEISTSSFRIIPPDTSPIWNLVNAKLTDYKKRMFDGAKESAECQNLKDPPRIRAMAIQKMFASDQYLSAKLDISQSHGTYGGLSGDAYNVDLAKGRMITINDLFDESEQKKILTEVLARTRNLYGSPGRLASLESVKFSFNAHTLVISFETVDEEGQFLPDDYVDIPIPLDTLFNGLGVKRRGPFLSR